MASDQLTLFSAQTSANSPDCDVARARMLDMIARLRAAASPPWKDEAEVILDDGAFHRAMRLVPASEAESLWGAYNEEADRLYQKSAAGGVRRWRVPSN